LAGAKYYDELDIIEHGGDDAFDVIPYSPDDDLPF
jgi:hypothetical protein